MKKKFVVVGAMAGTLIFAQSAFAAGLTVTPSKNTLSVQSGEGVQTVDAVPAYLYRDNNYFMLRDVGKILGYRVDWNEATKQVSLTKESAAQDLQHLSAAKQVKAVQQSKQTILVGAAEYKDMNCLNIDGYNYFKLRDLVEVMDFTCGWDSAKNQIQLSTGEQNDGEISVSVKDFLTEGANQKVIEADVPYIPGSNDFAALEDYMQKNVDKDFKASDFIVTESEEGSNTPNLITLDMRLNVNGVMAKNFGYRILCINKKAALITFIGEKNPSFDITKAGTQTLSDADAKQMALDADNNNDKVEKQTILRYFDMQELKQKCEVETTYVDNGGATFVTAHIFDAE